MLSLAPCSPPPFGLLVATVTVAPLAKLSIWNVLHCLPHISRQLPGWIWTMRVQVP